MGPCSTDRRSDGRPWWTTRRTTMTTKRRRSASNHAARASRRSTMPRVAAAAAVVVVATVAAADSSAAAAMSTTARRLVVDETNDKMFGVEDGGEFGKRGKRREEEKDEEEQKEKYREKEESGYAKDEFRIEISFDDIDNDSNDNGDKGGIFEKGKFPRRHEKVVPVDYGGNHPFEVMERQRRRRRRQRQRQRRDWRRVQLSDRDRDRVRERGEYDNDVENESVEGWQQRHRRRDQGDGGGGAEPHVNDDDDDDDGQWGNDTSSYRPLRIHYRTEGLFSSSSFSTSSSFSSSHSSSTSTTTTTTTTVDPERAERLAFLTQDILPRASSFWSSALRVYPATTGIIVQDNICFRLPNGPVQHDDADLVVVLVEHEQYCSDNVARTTDGNEVVGDGANSGAARSTTTSVEDGGNTQGQGESEGETGLTRLAGGSNCQQDQYDRPTVGLLFICPDTIDLSTDKTRSLFYDTVVHEFAHMLGFMWADFPYYYDRETGLPRTPDRKKQSFDCIDGETRDVIVPSKTTVAEVINARGMRHFEMVTPTVRNVVRNQFACPHMFGARLENQPTIANDCFGSHWDEALYGSELMSSVSTTARQYLSPLTLALFEDTGWYVANFSASSISPFGHGAGCRFASGPCVVDGSVPPYSRGLFCGPNEAEIGCSPDHRMVAACDIVTYERDLPAQYRYFDDPRLGGGLVQLDYCPAYLRESFLFPSGLRTHVDCTDVTLDGANFVSPAETFGPDSRCIETGYNRPYCFGTTCDETRHMVVVTVRTNSGEFKVDCHDGMTVTVPWILDLEIHCPSLARICPDLICPAHCSGRGTCLWSRPDPECRCNDQSDTSPMCANSPLEADAFPTVLPAPTTDDALWWANDRVAGSVPAVRSGASRFGEASFSRRRVAVVVVGSVMVFVLLLV